MVRHSKKQQIARQLGVSIGVLEQYLQLKRAEVEHESARVGQDDASPARVPLRGRRRDETRPA